eukprot:TRINITY_DN23564_c0_g1_i1.p1 TRINITY_DN23564_c0_g1~~TRINITY_DN23564_c0_g1_i1.p1  ORF type:complete len:333 (+),score=130.93 TRINITY_DN23564_c0_g1_i1:23-1000(+)
MLTMLVCQSEAVVRHVLEVLAEQWGGGACQAVACALVAVVQANWCTPAPISLVHSTPVDPHRLFVLAVDCDWHFEDNSLTAAMLSCYARLSAGRFFEQLFSSLLASIVNDDENLEVEKGLGITFSKKANAKKLADRANHVIENLFLVLKLLPTQIHRVFNFLVADKGISPAPLFMSSIICPAILDPLRYNLLEGVAKKGKLSSSVRRTLDLLAGLLLRIGKGSAYTEKGSSFEVLNACVEWHALDVATRLQMWSEGRAVATSATIPRVARDEEEQALAALFCFMFPLRCHLKENLPREYREHRLSYRLHELYQTAARLPVTPPSS